MPTYINTTNKRQNIVKFFIIISTIALIWIHSVSFETEVNDAFEPWWVWKRANEGKIKTIEKVSWEIANNNDVIQFFAGDNAQLKYNDLVYQSNQSKKSDVFQAYMRSVRSKKFIPKTIVVLGTKRDRIDPQIVENFGCKECVFSSKLDDVVDADAVVVGNGYCRTRPLPKRR